MIANNFSPANKTLLQYNSGLFIIDFAKGSLRFPFFAITKNSLRAECPFNPAYVSTHRIISGETDVEIFPLHSVLLLLLQHL